LRIFGSTISAFRWTAQNRRACAALADIADHPVFQFVETSELSSAQEPNNGRQRCSGWPRARVVEQSTKSDRQKHKKLVWEIEQIFRLTTSNGGVLTGRGADIILIDDPLKPEETLSDAFRRLKSTGRAGSPSPPVEARAFMQITARPYEDQP
jgi:hypothetical protein